MTPLPPPQPPRGPSRSAAFVAERAKQGAASLSGPLFPKDETADDSTLKAAEAMARHKGVIKLINFQNYVISILLILIFFTMPLLRPIYKYTAMKPDGAKGLMTSMMAPNLTDQAILSWSAKTITDLLTFGFGDMDDRILSLRNKFTSSGWKSFLKGFMQQKIWETFKSNQLVLTTAPFDQPVIVEQGPDEDGTYRWIVEMPVIMKYATNDMKSTSSRAIIRLTLVRVSVGQDPEGIGIEVWTAS